MTTGVAISTHKRPDTLAWALEGWAKAMPDVLVVINDIEGRGIAWSKNRGLATLMDAGCTSLFLCDDDVRPLIPEWWQPYIDSPHPHLMYLRPIDQEPYDDLHETRAHPNGCVLYYERHVIERVGGMRSEFGRYGSEHGEHSRRIHNTGLTPAPFIGLRDNPFHALDYIPGGGVESTVSAEEREASWAMRKKLRNKYRDSAEFVPYREDECTSHTSSEKAKTKN